MAGVVGGGVLYIFICLNQDYNYDVSGTVAETSER